jgi:putative peptide maturation system protein
MSKKSPARSKRACAGLGVISLAPPSAEGAPFSLRGLPRRSELERVRVDGRPLQLNEVALQLDSIWDDTRLLERIVDSALLQRELEREPIHVSDAELERALDEHRARHGLDTSEATEQWLSQRRLTRAGLEDLLERQIALRHLRHRLVGHSARARFEADPGRFDLVQLIAFPVDNDAEAEACGTAIHRGEDICRVAERALGGRPGARARRNIGFETTHRFRLWPSDVVTGLVCAGTLDGAGPYVFSIRAVWPSTWEAAREAVEEDLLDEWLRSARVRAVQGRLRSGSRLRNKISPVPSAIP